MNTKPRIARSTYIPAPADAPKVPTRRVKPLSEAAEIAYVTAIWLVGLLDVVLLAWALFWI